MSEENNMSEENKKTIISFIAGLLIGGLLVFIFVNPGDNAKNTQDAKADTASNTSDTKTDGTEQTNNEEAVTETTTNNNTGSNTVVSGNGSVAVDDQPAGNSVTLKNVVFPGDHGWIGVRDYSDGQLTGLLGVARWNNEDGLIPTSIPLLRSTVAGKTYAVVFYSDNGDKVFNLATDVQFGDSVETFKAE